MSMVRFLKTYTAWIIVINVAVFLALTILSFIFGGDAVLSAVGLQPASILQGQKLWTILTSMFSHIYFWHLAFNMISLFFVGIFVERLIGKRRFLIFYLLAGIFAGLFFAVLSGVFGSTFIGSRLFGDPSIIGIGASGAIFGLLGLLAILTPHNRVYLILGPLLAIVVQSILESLYPTAGLTNALSLILTIYVFMSIFFMFSFNPKMRKWTLPIEMSFWILPIAAIVPLLVIGLFVELPIGNAAHIGGLLAGLIYGFYLKAKYPRKTQMISRYFSKR